MAPEVMDPALDALSPSADLYALGVILWQVSCLSMVLSLGCLPAC